MGAKMGRPLLMQELAIAGRSGFRSMLPLQPRRVPPRFKSLRDTLKFLNQQDESSVILVRRVRGLVSAPEALLREHFAQSGVVLRVLAYWVHKSRTDRSARKGDMAFVLMASVADASRCLDSPSIACVGGVRVEVSAFQRTLMQRPAGS